MRRIVSLVALLSVACLPPQAGHAAPADPKTHPLSVAGRALDSNGMPVPEATILVVSTGGIPELIGKATTDGEGRYSFRDLALPIPVPASRAYFKYGSFRVLGRAPGRAFAWRAEKHLFLDERFQFDDTARTAGFYPDENIALDLTFEKPHPVAGRVVDEYERPIAGATVTITGCDFCDEKGGEAQPVHYDYRELSVGMRFLPDDFVTTSDADGRFALNSVPPECFCGLNVEHPEHTTGLARVATSEHPPNRERSFPLSRLPLAMKLRRRHAIPVRVSWADTGRPAGGVSVIGIPEPLDRFADIDRGVTDEEGNVVLRLPRGAYRLLGNPAPESDYVFSEQKLEVDERPRAQPVNLQIGRGSKLTFKVVDAKTGKGMPDVSFWWMRPRGWRDNLGKISSRQGSFTTNQDGELRTVILPGTRYYGLSLGPSLTFQSIDPADFNPGRELTLAAGQIATIEFKVNVRQVAEPPEVEQPVAESDEPVAIAGWVVYDGPPPPARLVFGQIGRWSRVWGYGPPVFDDSVLVDAETRGLANVLIYLDRVPPGLPVPAAPKTKARMSAVDGRFEPRISVLRAGQTFVFTNRDPEPVNVQFTPLRTTGVNRMVKPQETMTWRFDKPERVPYPVQCGCWGTKKAYQIVTDHPWVAVTDKTGQFAIRGLPPGQYQFNVWHETRGYLEKKLAVEVKSGAATTLNLTYPPARFGE